MNLESLCKTDFNPEIVSKYAKKLESIFASNSDIEKNAYMNWRVRPGNSQWRNFATVGEGFLATAYNLVQQCLHDNNDKKANSWIFPMFFNVVHELEIYLKAINTMLSYLLDKERKIMESRHDIQTLCGNAKNLLIRLKDREVEQTEQAEQAE